MLDLRQSISSYILRSRGITCPAGRIIITSGATQGISIISRILYRKDSSVVVEDPGNANLIKAISMCGYEIIPVPADELGLQTNLLPRGIQPAYVYVTPSHQFPLGGILPATRRMDLVRYAEEKECYIVEDDYDSEFRYDGPPLSSLYSLAPDRTIYVGTFSKALAPGLRLGYLLLPEKLVPACREMKKYTDVHTASLEQAALALFIDKGKLELHQRKMKKIYSLRRQALINALEEFFPVRHYIHGAATGLHLVAEFSDYVFDDTTVIRCREKKVGIHLLSRHCINKENTAGSLIFGYGHLEPEEIREGIARLAGSLIK